MKDKSKAFKSPGDIKIGMKVMLGEWSMYYRQCMQDGSPTEGVVTDRNSRSDDWFYVIWGNDHRNNYRYHDLYPVEFKTNEEALSLLKQI